MRRASLLRSSGFRLAATFTVLFLAAAVIAAATAYSVIREELLWRHQLALNDQFNFFTSTFKDGDVEDLRSTVEAYATASRNKDSIFLLQGENDRKLAGNVDTVPKNPPRPQVDATALGIDADFKYLVKQGEIGNYRLTIGESTEDISELEEIILEGTLWAALVLVSISLAVGAFLSRRMNRRIDLIQNSLERVADGHFDAPIPASGRGDDIDTLAQMINAAVARLGASVEGIRQISNDISHDLKTPLNRLRIVIEEAAEKQDEGQSVAKELDEAATELDRTIATFDALLRIAQIESGARKARFADVDVGTILTEVAEFYRSAYEDSGLELNLDVGNSQLQIQGDRELLTQMFANLLENALRHCSKGARIECAVKQVNDIVLATIADNGLGIPESEREKVLRRLYRLEQSRTTPGSGLGLAMVKAISDLHDAALGLHDNHPGLRVNIQFPLSRSGRG